MNPSIASPTREQLLDEFHAVVAETEQLLKTVASLGADQAGVLKGNVDKALVSATGKLSQLRDKSVTEASAAAAAADHYVRENPWRTVGVVALVAAFAGLVSGLVIAGRPRD